MEKINLKPKENRLKCDYCIVTFSNLRAPALVGILEDVTEVIDTNKFVVFGGSGCLDREIAYGKNTVR